MYFLCLLLLFIAATPPPPVYLLDIVFCAVPFGYVSSDCQEIRVGTLRHLIVRSLRTEYMGLCGKLDMLAWSQKPGSTLTPPPPTGWGSEGPPPPPAPMGRWTGGIHLKVTGDLEDKKGQVQTTVFTFDAVLLRCPTRSHLAIMHQ